MKVFQMKTLLLIHKTHLDIGFTDSAAEVTRHYLDTFIPAAIERAREMNTPDFPDRFTWTTGSWLIWKAQQEYRGQALRDLEEAIHRGWIVWHALPFTFSTELLSPALLRLGLKFSQDLDRRFNRKTRSAKMTDVPGHTRGLVPILAEAGVELLHIGVNPASSVPDVPEIFRWRSGGAELITVYAGTYGSVSEVSGCDTGLAFLHTNDNLGPPAPGRIEAEEAWLRARYHPEILISGSMDSFVDAVLPFWESLPVVDAEIGDTWVHGNASDPSKLADFAALRRAVDAHEEFLLKQPLQEIACWLEPLLLVAEHTWGLDAKGCFGSQASFRVKDLEDDAGLKAVRMLEGARDEQRAYIRTAHQRMQGELRISADHEISLTRQIRVPVPEMERGTPVGASLPLRAGRWLIRFDPSTNCLSTVHDLETGRDLCPASGRSAWGIPAYGLYGSESYRDYLDAYMGPPPRPWWAEEDFSKPGLHRVLPHDLAATLSGGEVSIRVEGNRTLLYTGMQFLGEPEVVENAPRNPRIKWTFHHEKPLIEVSIQWSQKAATRLPEAGWFGFLLAEPVAAFTLDKLGQQIDPATIPAGGGRHLHALDGAVRCRFPDGTGLLLHSPDALLVSPGIPRLLQDPAAPVSTRPGFWFLLFDNIWNTNFPLWNGEGMGYRFRIELTGNADLKST